MALADLINKAKSWASGNPDKARSAIDKVEDIVDSKTGGKYRDKVDKAGDALGGQLGIPKEGQAPAPQQPAPEGQAPAPQQPAPQQPAPQQPAPQQGQQTPPAAG